MGVVEALVAVVITQIVIAVFSVQRHRVHIEYLREDVKEAKQAAVRAHQRIDHLQHGKACEAH